MMFRPWSLRKSGQWGGGGGGWEPNLGRRGGGHSATFKQLSQKGGCGWGGGDRNRAEDSKFAAELPRSPKRNLISRNPYTL